MNLKEQIKVMSEAIWDNGYYSKNLECKELAIKNLTTDILKAIEEKVMEAYSQAYTTKRNSHKFLDMAVFEDMKERLL